LRNLSLEDLLDSIAIRKFEFERQCTAPEGPSLSILKSISDSFQITIDDLLLNQVDENWVKDPRLSDQYFASSGSKFRTSLAVIHWLEKQYGPALANNLLRSLKVPHHLVHQPDQVVKLKLLRELLRAAALRGVPESDFFEMGVAAVDIPENRRVRQELAHTKSGRELFEAFFGQTIQHFENNYNYSILRADHSTITLEIKPREERVEENGRMVVSDRLLSIYRWGVTAGLLKCIGMRPAEALPLQFASRDTMTESVRLSWNRDQAAFFRSRRFPESSLRLV
jgi:hypothetical protein